MMFKIRDKETFILFIIGFCLSFFIVLNGYHLLNAWYMEMIKLQSETKYVNSVQFSIEGELDESVMTIAESRILREKNKKKADGILHVLAGQDKTTYLKGIYLPIGKAAEPQYTNVILSYSEEWYRTLQSGRYPTKEELESDTKYAVISESAQQYVEESAEGDVIRIQGEKYIVSGVFDNYKASEYDMEICIFYKTDHGNAEDIVHQKIADALEGGMLDVCIGSNQYRVEKLGNKLMNEIRGEYQCNTALVEYMDEDSGSDLYAEIKGVLLVVLFLVSMINCSQIAKLWMVKKQRDLVILKTYGFNNNKIIKKIAVELIQIISVSMLLVTLLDCVYLCVFNPIEVPINVYIRNAFFLLLAFLVVMMIAISPAVHSVKKIEPAIGLREL